MANGITTVHLAYAREGTGHALIAARQWIPREHLEDPARRRVMRLPPDLAFRTKGQLAIDLLAEVLADGIRLDFACGDEVYGSCTQLREYLEARGQAYVLRVPSNFYLTVARGVRLTCKQAAAALAGAGRGWEVRSAGTGAKGQRWYAWAWLGTASSAALPAHPPPPDHRRAGLSLLLRTRRPAGVAVPAGPRRRAAAGRLKKISDPGRAASGSTSPRSGSYTAIARHTVLVMAALAICAVTAALLRRRTDTRAPAPRPAGPAPARRPGDDPAHRPRDRPAARPSAPARRQPRTGWPGAAATRPCQPGTTSAPGSPETNRFSLVS